MNPLATLVILSGGIYGAAKIFGGKKKTSQRVANPFSDKACTTFRSKDAVENWLNTVGFRRYQEAHELNPIGGEDDYPMINFKIAEYVAYAMAQLPKQCTPFNAEPARRDLYKAVWCSVTIDLATRGRIDEEVADIIAMCINPSFDPLTDPNTNPNTTP